MKRALIATLFNEADNVSRWWESIARQTVLPDEIVIVDGGSKDGTWEKLQALAGLSPVPVRLKQQRCNIAEGRNLAIAMTDAEIIASSDAGSFVDPHWFGEITRPLLENPAIDIVGGKSVPLAENDFQKFVAGFDSAPGPTTGKLVQASGRNTAYRRTTWADVGGYPEWLTLTAEDALFNFQLEKAGKQFFYQPSALVSWLVRENPAAYFKMLYSYGYGAAEARLDSAYFLRRATIAVLPPLLFFSSYRFNFLEFRYRKCFSSATGWLAGFLNGQRAPVGWKRTEGVLMSPQAQNCLARGTRSA